jgi:hypothetical protein
VKQAVYQQIRAGVDATTMRGFVECIIGAKINSLIVRYGTCVEQQNTATKQEAHFPNIKQYLSYQFENGAITVWHNYGIGCGMRIPISDYTNTKNFVTDAISPTICTKLPLRALRTRLPSSVTVELVQDKQSATNAEVTYECTDSECLDMFLTKDDLHEHISIGVHNFAGKPLTDIDKIKIQFTKTQVIIPNNKCCLTFIDLRQSQQHRICSRQSDVKRYGSHWCTDERRRCTCKKCVKS